MFCRNCGRELPDGVRFCPSCGTSVTPAERRTDATQAHDGVVSQPSHDTTAPVGRPSVSRRAVLAGLGIAAGVAAVALTTCRLGVWGNDGGAASAVVAYGSRAATLVSRVTRIVPKDASGQPVARYTVRVRSATSGTGADVDVSAIEPFEAEGTGGFALQEIAGIEPGMTVELTVTTEGGDPQWVPPLRVAEEGNEAGAAWPFDATAGSGSSGEAMDEPPEELSVLPAELVDGAEEPNEGGTMRLGKWGAFLRVVRDAITEYGEVELTTGTTDDVSSSWLEGLAMARLVDFGDGSERLVIACPSTTSPSSSPSAPAYEVSVWEYDDQADATQEVVSYTSDGWYDNYVDFVPGSPEGHVYIFYDQGIGCSLYGLAEDGSMRALCETSYDSDGTPHFYVDGTEVDYDTLFASYEGYGFDYASDDRTMRVLSYDWTSGADSGSTTPDDQADLEETAQETRDTTAKLENLAGDLVDAAQAQEDAGEDTTPADVSYTYETLDREVDVPQYANGYETPSSIDATIWTYLAFAANVSDAQDGIDAVNAALLADLEKAAVNTEGMTGGNPNAETLSYSQTLDYLSGTTCSVRRFTSLTNWGGGGSSWWDTASSLCFNLATGESVTVWDAAGVNLDELDEQAQVVIYDFFEPLARDYYPLTTDAVRSYLFSTDQDGNRIYSYLLTEDGITVWVMEGAFLYAAAGSYEILVWPFGDLPAGTDVTQRA